MAENMVLAKQVEDLRKEVNKRKAEMLTLRMELHKERVEGNYVNFALDILKCLMTK